MHCQEFSRGLLIKSSGETSLLTMSIQVLSPNTWKLSFIFISDYLVLGYVDTDMTSHKGHFTIEQGKLNYLYYSLLLHQYFMFHVVEKVLLLLHGWHCCHPIRKGRKELMFGMINKLLIGLMDLLQLSTEHSGTTNCFLKILSCPDNWKKDRFL